MFFSDESRTFLNSTNEITFEIDSVLISRERAVNSFERAMVRRVFIDS